MCLLPKKIVILEHKYPKNLILDDFLISIFILIQNLYLKTKNKN